MEIHYTQRPNRPRKTVSITRLVGVLLLIYPDVQAQNTVAGDSSRISFYQQRFQNTLTLARQRGWTRHIQLNVNQISSLQRMDALGEPVYYTSHGSPQAVGTRTTALYTGGTLGLNLSGNTDAVRGKVAIWDGGNIRSDHQELNGKITQEDMQAGMTHNDHATHMAGIMVGKGVNSSATGMAYEAGLRAWNFDNDFSEIIRQAPGLLISNHAYGPITGWVLNTSRAGGSNDEKWEWWGTPSVHEQVDYRFGFYDESTSELDRIAYNSPYFLMVRSADNKRTENGPPPGTKYFLKNTSTQSTQPRSPNNGYDIIPSDATAKNILTVGSAEPLDNSYNVAPYSGWGPTDDGRIKPDLLGMGTRVLSSLGTGVNSYGILSGTSMASANVSGTLLLLQELYHQRRGAFMLASTLKGLVLHTAEKPHNEIAPSYTYGWGLLNAEKAAKAILNSKGNFLIDEKVLPTGASLSYSFLASGEEPLIVTLCWTDPEALPTQPITRNVNNRSPKLTNDLDIVIQEGFNSYQPWTLNPDVPSQKAQTGNNSRDNTEQIFIANPLAGRTYTLVITHKNVLKNGRQPFSLIASGIASPSCGEAVALTPDRDTTLCAGQTLTVTASAGSGLTYEWMKNGATIKRGTDRMLEVSTPGIYTVRVTAPGCSALSKPITVKASSLFADISQKGKQVVCHNEGIALTANSGSGYAYQWLLNDTPIQGATAARYQATRSGAYRVQVSHQGCTTVSLVTDVEVSPVSSALDPTASIPICNGSPALLKAPQQNGYTYAWFYNNTLINGATASSLKASSPGRYAVEVRNGSCSSRSADVLVQEVDVRAMILPPSSTLIGQGSSVSLQASHAVGNSYSWYRNDTLLRQETAPLLKASQPGFYKVRVENKGCRAESAAVLLLTDPITFKSPQDGTDVLATFPNPAQDVLEVAYRPVIQATHAQVSIHNLNGQTIQTGNMKPEMSVFRARLNISTLPAGLYLIRVESGGQSHTRQFVKH